VEEQSIAAALTGEDSRTATGVDNMQGGKAELGRVCQRAATGRSCHGVHVRCAAAEAGAWHGSGSER
jgi:hypothetical protein